MTSKGDSNSRAGTLRRALKLSRLVWRRYRLPQPAPGSGGALTPHPVGPSSAPTATAALRTALLIFKALPQRTNRSGTPNPANLAGSPAPKRNPLRTRVPGAGWDRDKLQLALQMSPRSPAEWS